MSCFRLVNAKKTSLLVTIFVLCVSLLASCGGSTDEGSNGSNNGSNEQEPSSSDSEKEEASKTDSNDRSEENTDSSEVAASSSDSKDQNQGEDQASIQGSNNKGESPPPNYPDPPPQPIGLPAAFNPEPGNGWYHPDVDRDGIGSGDAVEYQLDKQPLGWVDYSYVHWDNCPETPNANQEDSDNDGWGDFCDPEPFIPYNPNQAK